MNNEATPNLLQVAGTLQFLSQTLRAIEAGGEDLKLSFDAVGALANICEGATKDLLALCEGT